MSYLNSPRKGRPRGMITCVWTHLGQIKCKTSSRKNKEWKTTSNKKMEDDLKQKIEDDLNEIGDNLKKMEDNLKKWRATSKINGR